jgi:hypothetical protein
MILAGLLFGHVMGDYVLQPPGMAVGKSAPGNCGTLLCLLHTCIYSTAVCSCLLFTGLRLPGLVWWGVAWLVVFNTHFWIDRFTLAKHILKLHGRDPFDPNPVQMFYSNLCYVLVDNTAHLMLMYFALEYLARLAYV